MQQIRVQKVQQGLALSLRSSIFQKASRLLSTSNEWADLQYKIKQVYNESLTRASYIVESSGEAAIIDPPRDVEDYLDYLNQNNLKLKYIMETHFHDDFISGHLDLQKATGAEIVYGPQAKPEFHSKVVEDSTILELGDVFLKCLHTPGHSDESSCFILKNSNKEKKAVFTGDTLLIGEVGNLNIESTSKKMLSAKKLFQTIRKQLGTLPDSVLILPGLLSNQKNSQNEKWSNIGQEKQTNPVFTNKDVDTFITSVILQSAITPEHTAAKILLNKAGYEPLETVLKRSMNPLTVEEVLKIQEKGGLLLDARNDHSYAEGHIPGSWNIPAEHRFAIWAGSLVNCLTHPIILITDNQKSAEKVIKQMALVGLTNCAGYLKGGIAAWKEAGQKVKKVERISQTDLEIRKTKETSSILDVREVSAKNRIEGVCSIPLQWLQKRKLELSKNSPIYVMEGENSSSMIACSILLAEGWNNVISVSEGFSKIPEADISKL